MRDQKTSGWDSLDIFLRRFDILLYAVRATEPLTVKLVAYEVLGLNTSVSRRCLRDLVECGMLERTSTTKYVATEYAKELLGVNHDSESGVVQITKNNAESVAVVGFVGGDQ